MMVTFLAHLPHTPVTFRIGGLCNLLVADNCSIALLVGDVRNYVSVPGVPPM